MHMIRFFLFSLIVLCFGSNKVLSSNIINEDDKEVPAIINIVGNLADEDDEKTPDGEKIFVTADIIFDKDDEKKEDFLEIQKKKKVKKIGFGKKVKRFLCCYDQDNDEDVDWKDVGLAFKNLWNDVRGMFDADGDGVIEFKEIIQGTQLALRKFGSLAEKVLLISDGIQKNEYFKLIPKNVKDSLKDLFNVVDYVAKQTQQGIHVGDKFVEKISESLKNMKKQIADLGKNKLSAEQFATARKDIFSYLEMIKGWGATGDNAKLVTDLEKKLAKLKM